MNVRLFAAHLPDMSRYRPSTPQSTAALASRADAEYRAALYGGNPAPGRGQMWWHKTTGATVVVIGRKASHWALRLADERVVLVGLRDHALNYDLFACDLASACCPLHRTHVSPHVGGVLR